MVPLPSDDMKGRIIGRDGRNIRAFEGVTGVNIIVDDTPEAVAISAFDPVRREVARIALERLIADGRIHPASIEDAYEKALAEVEQRVRDAGEWAMLEVGISRMHPELVNLLGRLKYRLSYGQNVLNHLVETAKVAGMLAAEIGVDPVEARRAAFLHDIGKAVSHELGGSHALVGAEIARRFGETPAIVHGIEAHHNEVEPRTLTAVIVQAADAVSASRPGRGARRWSPTCGGWSSSRRSPAASPGWSGCTPCRPGARCAWWSTRDRWTTSPPMTWRAASPSVCRRTCSTRVRSR